MHQLAQCQDLYIIVDKMSSNSNTIQMGIEINEVANIYFLKVEYTFHIIPIPWDTYVFLVYKTATLVNMLIV